jgi:hypothetical protein
VQPKACSVDAAMSTSLHWAALNFHISKATEKYWRKEFTVNQVVICRMGLAINECKNPGKLTS